MDDSSLDEGPSADFARATLQIAKENEASHQNQVQPSSNDNAQESTNEASNTLPGTIPVPKTVPSISFKRIDAHSFFSDRNDVVERAITDCTHTLAKDGDGEIVGCWLLTQISLWDTEKERLILLTKTALYTIKYDFISLKTLEYSRVPLSEIDTVVNGELVYPPTSLVPRLNGLAEGVSSVFHNAARQQWSSFAARSSFGEFESRSRNMIGLQLMWNKGKPLPLEKKWNPFARNIPWLTFASHPLFWHKGTEMEKMKFDVEGLQAALIALINFFDSYNGFELSIVNYRIESPQTKKRKYYAIYLCPFKGTCLKHEMVLRCSVKGCHRNSVKDRSHSFFGLPRNSETREKWIQFTEVSNPPSHIRICTDHFDQNTVRKRYPRPLLVRNAVPTIRVPVAASSDKPPVTQNRLNTCGEETHERKPDIQIPEEVSPVPTQIINIHMNNVSSIIIADKNKKIILNIIKDRETNCKMKDLQEKT